VSHTGNSKSRSIRTEIHIEQFCFCRRKEKPSASGFSFFVLSSVKLSIMLAGAMLENTLLMQNLSRQADCLNELRQRRHEAIVPTTDAAVDSSLFSTAGLAHTNNGTTPDPCRSAACRPFCGVNYLGRSSDWGGS